MNYELKNQAEFFVIQAQNFTMNFIRYPFSGPEFFSFLKSLLNALNLPLQVFFHLSVCNEFNQANIKPTLITALPQETRHNSVNKGHLPRR